MISTIDDMRKTLEAIYHLTGLGKIRKFFGLGAAFFTDLVWNSRGCCICASRIWCSLRIPEITMSMLMVISGPIHRFHLPLSGRALRICDRAECFCRCNTFIYSMHANYDVFWYCESRCYQNADRWLFGALQIRRWYIGRGKSSAYDAFFIR